MTAPIGETSTILTASKGKATSYSVPVETPQISCRRFVKYLSACYDGELEEAVRVCLEAHRVGCAQCAQYATGFEAAITLTKNALAVSAAYAELSEDLTQAILTACRETN